MLSDCLVGVCRGLAFGTDYCPILAVSALTSAVNQDDMFNGIGYGHE